VGELARLKNRLTVDGTDRALMYTAYTAKTQATRRQFT